MPPTLSTAIAEKYKRAAGLSTTDLWAQVIAMIQELIASGVPQSAVEQEVDKLINGASMPAFIKPMLVSLANAVIVALFNAINPTPAPAPSIQPLPAKG